MRTFFPGRLISTHALDYFLLLLCAMPLRADVRVAGIFGDHMVLQAGVPVPVWGWADPGEDVKVSFAGQQKSVAAGADGKWMLRLDHLTPGGPLEMTVAGKNTIKIGDVLVGQVWLGSGQSNMDFVVSRNLEKYPGRAQRFAGVINEEAEIAAASHPLIRMFTVPARLSPVPLDDLDGRWEVCSPETVPGFSAIGYFFARDLQRATGQPVGFIKTAFGASCAQAWVSRQDLAANPRFAGLLEKFDREVQSHKEALAGAMAPQEPGAPQGRPGAAKPPRDPLADQHNPYLLWNAMVKPIQPFAIKGMLWYQGESITEGLDLYPELIGTLVTSWRSQWGQGDFPFYFVQLAALDKSSNRPEVREAQAKALSLPNSAMAVTIDIGDKSDVHPHNKQDVGARLARIARARDYGEKIESSGPVLESTSREGNALRLTFRHADGGLVAKDGLPGGFEVAGIDGKYFPASAEISGSTVLVSSPDVSDPADARYAWSRWPEGANLYNAAGLPAPPFRTKRE